MPPQGAALTPERHECPLCGGPTAPHHQDARRGYRRCPRCQLVHVPPHHHLAPSAERAVYDQHENSPADLGYRRFLARALDPLLARVPQGGRGLDFGAGPGPTLSVMAAERGYPCEIYDPFYAPDPKVLRQDPYDFIAATEVIEHVAAPHAVLTQLFSMLKPLGWLALMTKRTTTQGAFARWHYIQDPTHVCFFADGTFRWIGAHFGAEVHLVDRDVVLLQAGP